jgi:hypothetical protein
MRACGAQPDQIQREQTRYQQDEQQRKAGSAGRSRFTYVAGILGFSVMSVQGLFSSLNPQPDGRLLNAAPTLGVDLFLFVGLMGIAFCFVQLIRVSR